ncbi:MULTISPECIES: GNAT family N-acetyltransferase [unclassified Clostridium]|uniref:GNAT family N-acetyltransferase n=1 Tax=unclassified Clostridium TaxID=2614128 RepID=UPI00321713CE
MKFQKWSKEILSYELRDGYRLERADNKGFTDYYTVYSQMNIANGFFMKSYDVMRTVVDDEDECFWIIKDDKKIGGVFIEPNNISELFIIPPYSNVDLLLERLKEILVFWSDTTKDILADIVQPSLVENYEKIGFKKIESGRWMIRPIEEFNIMWGEGFYANLPKRENQGEIGKLLYEAFENNVNLHSSYTLEEYTGWVKEYFDDYLDSDMLNRASTLVYDGNTNELVGVCYVSLWQEWPLISQIAVKPSYEGRGIGTKMLKKALTILKKEYPVVRLYVDIGNEAEEVYENLGFLKGLELTQMKLV